MDKSTLLEGDFLKQFKSGAEFTTFMDTLYKRGIEALLEGELDAHLGYDKHQKRSHTNARNGYSSKTIKTESGETQIQVPRDRESSFEPVIVPKGRQVSQGIENVIISLYAKGMSTSDIEEQLHEVYGFQLSTTSISR
ncbi:transposase, partial [Arcicella sp. DC2W]